MLKPIIEAFVENGNRDNLLQSTILELLEYIRKVPPVHWCVHVTVYGKISIFLESKEKSLSSGLCHLIHIFVQENKKSLVLYVVESFWKQLVKFGHLGSIQAFRLKYQEVLRLGIFVSCILSSLSTFYH
jgi:protein phosphatase-4 regulatory subunit 3